jgi:Outer membrane protein beta-barrel domain
MKRSIAYMAIIGLVLTPVMAHAQLGFAIKGGGSFGNVSNRGVLPGNLGTRTGFAVGVALGSSGGVLGFGLEGLYAQRGVQSATAGDSRSLDYIDVPLYLRLMVPTPGLAPYAYAGPQVSFELHCSNGSSACSSAGRSKISTAAVLGGGVRLGERFTFEGRYVYGLTDLKLNTVTSSSSYKTRSFLLLVGFAL